MISLLRRPLAPTTRLFSAMTTQKEFKQAPHKLLVIPGPVEVTDQVLFANAHPTISHVAPDFIPVFGDCLRMTRKVVFAHEAQPFLISGSGTLGWDQVSANLIERGDNALMINTGYFGDSFADCLETYGASVTQVKAKVGHTVPLEEIERALTQQKYKLLGLTHVDTSTGVLSDAKAIAELTRRVSPDTLVVVDAVCSVASETIRFDDWDLDVLLSAPQKGIGAPPGLSILLASKRAISTFETRQTPPSSYYASWKKWLPIMQAYEAGLPKYFATPPVNLMYAYKEALGDVLGGHGLEWRENKHKQVAKRVREEVKKLGLSIVAKEGVEANGMTAIYYPEGITPPDLLPRLVAKNVVVASWLHSEIKEKYFRIGHMGITAVDDKRGDIDKIFIALKEALEEAKAAKVKQNGSAS